MEEERIDKKIEELENRIFKKREEIIELLNEIFKLDEQAYAEVLEDIKEAEVDGR